MTSQLPSLRLKHHLVIISARKANTASVLVGALALITKPGQQARIVERTTLIAVEVGTVIMHSLRILAMCQTKILID